MPITEVPEGYPMVVVRYEGPTAKHEVIGLATGRHYGRKQHGDVIHMDKADVDAFPEMFVVLASPSAPEAPALPKLPTALRPAEQVLRPSAKPIVEVAPTPSEPTLDELGHSASATPGSSFVLEQPEQRQQTKRRKRRK